MSAKDSSEAEFDRRKGKVWREIGELVEEYGEAPVMAACSEFVDDEFRKLAREQFRSRDDR